jgi:hypothetical protein
MQEKASEKLEAILFGERARRFGNALAEIPNLFGVLNECRICVRAKSEPP